MVSCILFIGLARKLMKPKVSLKQTRANGYCMVFGSLEIMGDWDARYCGQGLSSAGSHEWVKDN